MRKIILAVRQWRERRRERRYARMIARDLSRLPLVIYMDEDRVMTSDITKLLDQPAPREQDDGDRRRAEGLLSGIWTS